MSEIIYIYLVVGTILAILLLYLSMNVSTASKDIDIAAQMMRQSMSSMFVFCLVVIVLWPVFITKLLILIKLKCNGGAK